MLAMKTIHTLFVGSTLLLSGTITSSAAVSLLITGTPGSSIVNIELSGTGTFTSNIAAANVNGQDFNPFDPIGAGVSGNFGFASGAATFTIHYDGFDITRNVTSISFIDSTMNTGQDFIGLNIATTSVSPDQTYTMSGSGTLDLSSLFVSGSPMTFDDLNAGIGTAASVTGMSVDSFNVTIQQVPEPSSAGLLGLGAAWGVLRRRRS